MPKFIAISGSIGVGKSTLSKRIASSLPNSQLFEERGEENPYLDLFYSDMERWGFHNRIAFLDLHTKVFRQIQNNTDYVVTDRCIHEVAVFSRIQESMTEDKEREYKLYWSLYQTVIHLVPRPTKVLYLRCSIDTAYQRILRRGHSYEMSIDLSYLTAIQNYYDEWIKESFSMNQVMVIDTDSFDTRNASLDLIVTWLME